MLKFFQPKPFLFGVGTIVVLQALWFLLIPLFFLGQADIQGTLDIILKICILASIAATFFWSKSLSLGLTVGYVLIFSASGFAFLLNR